jgi:hypothetical protein
LEDNVCATVNDPSPLLRRTDTVLEARLATARSSRPSQFASSAAIPIGVSSTSVLRAAPKVPSGSCNSTDALPGRAQIPSGAQSCSRTQSAPDCEPPWHTPSSLTVDTATSGRPSLLKSPSVTPPGLIAVE